MAKKKAQNTGVMPLNFYYSCRFHDDISITKNSSCISAVSSKFCQLSPNAILFMVGEIMAS